jgi:hypothetical protein
MLAVSPAVASPFRPPPYGPGPYADRSVRPLTGTKRMENFRVIQSIWMYWSCLVLSLPTLPVARRDAAR